MLDRNTLTHLTVYKIMRSGSFKNVFKKWVYRSYISSVCVKTGFGIK